MNVLKDASCDGSNQLHEGVRCPWGAEPSPTFTRATTDSSRSSTTSRIASTSCRRAETWIPR